MEPDDPTPTIKGPRRRRGAADGRWRSGRPAAHGAWRPLARDIMRHRRRLHAEGRISITPCARAQVGAWLSRQPPPARPRLQAPEASKRKRMLRIGPFRHRELSLPVAHRGDVGRDGRLAISAVSNHRIMRESFPLFSCARGVPLVVVSRGQDTRIACAVTSRLDASARGLVAPRLHPSCRRSPSHALAGLPHDVMERLPASWKRRHFVSLRSQRERPRSPGWDGSAAPRCRRPMPAGCRRPAGWPR
jgi:hypothetical protein